MSYMFCDDLTEAVALEAQAKKEAEQLLRELPLFVKAPTGAIEVKEATLDEIEELHNRK